MSSEVRKLSPEVLWKNFADLNAVPRPSKKEERVIAFAKSFGENLGLETVVDEVGNVIIKKPATQGMEDRVTVALQSHLDMVHQKNSDTTFDFDNQGIQMLVEDDWVKAKGTTLGADNGIGVAAIMALLESTNIPHPPLEALFTIDEETGMTGAMGLKGGLLDAKIMLNLDTEDDDELTIGCAGGIDVTGKGTYNEEPTPENHTSYKIELSGLTGGHSGMDIHLGRGNANKLMNRFLYNVTNKFNVRIHNVNGGGLRNAIPRESFASIAVDNLQVKEFQTYFDLFKNTLKSEYRELDPELSFETSRAETLPKVLNSEFQHKILRSVYACPNGIYRMSPSIEGLVQTSNNIARVLIINGQFELLCLTRSSVDSEKQDLTHAISSAFEFCGAETSFDGAYPGWEPRNDAAITGIMKNLYKHLFNEDPHVNACHAGLECGILGQHYPEMEMISFGPNIRGAHSPDEKAQISSVQKFWKFLLATLAQIPSKNG